MNPPIPQCLARMGLDNGDSANGNPKLSTLHDDAYFAAATARPKIQGLRDIGILNSRRTASLNVIRGVASACIDEDNSGTYDPNEFRLKTTISQPRRTKKAKRGDGNEDSNRERRTRRDTQIGYSLPVTFALGLAKGLDYLRSISPGSFDYDPTGHERSMESTNTNDGIFFTRRQVKKPSRLGDEIARYAYISRMFNTANKRCRVDGLTLD
jgi:hypothetical protein